MSFEKNLNTYQFKTTNIKGKQYVEVNQRVIAFRTLSEFKGYGLTTEVLHLDADSCVIQATISDADRRVVAQGMAQEDKSSSRINQTSYVENCETSAVGRALGFLGIGIETSIATADEVDMAIKKQDTRLPKEKQQRNLCECCDVHQGGQTSPSVRHAYPMEKYGST